MRKKVCHITTAHLPEDIRVFQKECVSLAEAGYEVTLIEAGNTYDKKGVHIIGLGPLVFNRLKRISTIVNKAYKIAKIVNADIYHIHDPELLRIGIRLKKIGKKVVFDSHEDYPAQIVQKEWIPHFLRFPVSQIYEKYEKNILSCFDGIIGVTPHQVERLKEINNNTIMVSNFPTALHKDIIPKFESKRITFPGMAYDGWCIKEILDAIEPISDITFSIRSTFDVNSEYLEQLKRHPAWKKVDLQGRQPHSKIIELLSDSMCGLAISKYGPNVNGRKGTLGNTKLFEYMQVGIPVICTDLDLWKDIIDTYKCGICVKPNDIGAIRDAIIYILSNPLVAKEMGERGKRAIKEKYCWEQEVRKIDELYRMILK